jgi:hypothetical protein
LSPFRKIKSITLKVAKEKSNSSSDDDGLAMFARNFRKFMNSSKGKFRNKNAKFFENSKGDSKGTDQDKHEFDKKDPRSPRCFECSGYGHIRPDCGNIKQSKGKAFNTTLSDDFDYDETPGKDSNYLPFAASYDSPYESNDYYSKNSGLEDEQNELQRFYNKLYVHFSELREVNKRHVKRLNEFEIERSRLIEKVKCLEDKLIESHGIWNNYLMLRLFKC